MVSNLSLLWRFNMVVGCWRVCMAITSNRSQEQSSSSCTHVVDDNCSHHYVSTIDQGFVAWPSNGPKNTKGLERSGIFQEKGRGRARKNNVKLMRAKNIIQI